MSSVELSNYKSHLIIGASKPKQLVWFFINAFLFQSSWIPISGVKVFVLRLFGAKIGKGVVLKPSMNIKYPWKLKVGDHCWVGEKVWIDNLDEVCIGNNVCISQGALLLTGNHNYKSVGFELITGRIVLEDGVWIGANSTVCPGITCKEHSVLSVGSVATKNLEAFTIYCGVPAVEIRKREIL